MGRSEYPQPIPEIHNEQELIQVIDTVRLASHQRLGELLVDSGQITEEQLIEALGELKGLPRSHLGRVLVDKGWIDADHLTATLAHQLGIPQVRLSDFETRPDAATRIPAEFALGYNVLPLALHDNTLVIATPKPFDEQMLAALRFYTGHGIEPVLASAEDIGQALNRFYATEAAVRAAEELDFPSAATMPRKTATDPHSAEKEAMRKPVVRLVNAIILQAVHRGASDINIRPVKDQVNVYYRVDGKLRFVRGLQKTLLRAVVSRIRITANIDVAEHRRPQDGHTRVRIGDKLVDLRISIMPTINGESVVIRILDKERGLKSMEQIGFSDDDTTRLRRLMSRSNGIFLVTGPTGSGKSTTLYALLQELSREQPHIITVEDPVEYDVDGAEQIQIASGIGYTFAEALRHILRHDPDVIMVGEIRDLETARIANKAALTGHLVLSTLHTNDAASAVTRLADMGVEPYLLGSTVLGVMAQRLIRLNCPHCLAEEKVPKDIRATMGVGPREKFKKGQGCRECDQTGYAGRTVVYELLVVEGELSALVSRGSPAHEIREAAVRAGMIPLTRCAVDLARHGRTSLAEAYAVRLENSA